MSASTRKDDVTLDRAERDALAHWCDVQLDWVSVSDQEEWEHVRRFGTLHDEIGWTNDEPRAAFVVTADREWLRAIALEARSDHAEALEYELSWPDAAEPKRAEYISELRERVRVYEQILARLDGQVTA